MDERYHSVALRRLDGRPDQNGYFPNLKTLRAYVACTGEPIERFRFDLQKGKTASEGTKARTHAEDHHAERFVERLQYEAAAFAAKIDTNRRPPSESFQLPQ